MTTHIPSFAPQQVSAINAVGRWLRHDTSSQQIFRLFGYAGTGKTTIARHVAGCQDGNIVYTAFTGKAALMMQRNGCEGACTIHSLIYQPMERSNGDCEFKLNLDSVAADASLIVVDECSMVNAELARDLMSFGRPILVLGDPGQLPPIAGPGFFTGSQPDAMLTEIHRQARDNPIIQLATTVREGVALRLGSHGDSRVLPEDQLKIENMVAADQTLVGRNATRQAFNQGIRSALARPHWAPEVGDRLICTCNDYSKNILNGSLFSITDLLEHDHVKRTIRMRVKSIDFSDRAPFTVNVRQEHFTGGLGLLDWKDLRGTQQIDYGYAQTVH